jgi:hypothetical protein
MEEGDALAEALLAMPRAGWAPPDLEALESVDPEALIAAVTRAEALLAEATDALVHAEQALTSLRQLLHTVSCPRGEIRSHTGIFDDWETAVVLAI